MWRPSKASAPPPESKAANCRIGEVERLLSNLEIGSFASRDEQEVAGYAEVMEIVFRAWEDLPFTENYIKQFHRDLLRHSGKDIRASWGVQEAFEQRRGHR